MQVRFLLYNVGNTQCIAPHFRVFVFGHCTRALAERRNIDAHVNCDLTSALADIRCTTRTCLIFALNDLAPLTVDTCNLGRDRSWQHVHGFSSNITDGCTKSTHLNNVRGRGNHIRRWWQWDGTSNGIGIGIGIAVAFKSRTSEPVFGQVKVKQPHELTQLSWNMPYRTAHIHTNIHTYVSILL